MGAAPVSMSNSLQSVSTVLDDELKGQSPGLAQRAPYATELQGAAARFPYSERKLQIADDIYLEEPLAQLSGL